MKRVDYQNQDADLDEVNERRTAEIRAWAKADQDNADALIGVPDITTFDDWDVVEPDLTPVNLLPIEEEEEQEEEEEEEKEAVGNAENVLADETPKTEPKKAPAKKVAAEPKEAKPKG